MEAVTAATSRAPGQQRWLDPVQDPAPSPGPQRGPKQSGSYRRRSPEIRRVRPGHSEAKARLALEKPGATKTEPLPRRGGAESPGAVVPGVDCAREAC